MEKLNDNIKIVESERMLHSKASEEYVHVGKRGVIFGIPFYAEGDENWDSSIPQKGREAEKGCKGCPWYDIAEWRKRLLEILDKEKNKGDASA